MSRDFRQVTVGSSGPSLLAPAGHGDVLIKNTDQAVTVWLTNDQLDAVADPDVASPLDPGGTVVLDGKENVYGICAPGQKAVCTRVPGGRLFFQFSELLLKTLLVAASQGNGVFVYSAAPGLGDLIAAITGAAGSDPYGNPVPNPGLTAFSGVNQININGNSIAWFASNVAVALLQANGVATIFSDDGAGLPLLFSFSRVDFQTVPAVHGGAASVWPAGKTPLSVAGSSSSGQALYVEQDGNTDHAITANQKGTGSSQAAINAVSSNPNFTTLEATGQELNRGTVKIAHQGQAAGTDANASALSIDVQTVFGGATGTKARGIFITSTTDTNPAGDAIVVRYNGLDAFVIKGSGRVGIGGAVGHVPAGMLELVQQDTATAGLAMTAIAAGTDMLRLKDSTGASRVIVDNGGHLIIGGASAATAADLEVHDLVALHSHAAPGTPPGGYGYLYVSATDGSLHYKGASGTDTQIAPG